MTIRRQLLREIEQLLLVIYRLLHRDGHRHRKSRPSPPSEVSIRLSHHHHRGNEMKATITWSDPTERADGTPLAASEIAFIEVFQSSDNGNSYASIGHAAAGQQSFTTDDLPAGGTYLFKLETDDTQTPAAVSADSSVVSVSVAPPALAAPNAPSNVAASLA